MKPLTKNRAELLKLFLTNPGRSLYMQEIGRILNKKPGAFQRTLNNLVSEGILESEYRANARYFKANKNYPLYNELKSIIFKTVGIKGTLKETLEKIGGIKFAFIYGSFAKAKANYMSDIDIAIVGNPNENVLIGKLDRMEERLQREINYNLYNLKEFKKAFAEKEPFILEILRDKKDMLLGNENELRKFFKS